MTGSSREFYGTGTNFFWYRDRYFFPGPNFCGTGTGTFFGTKFFRYRYRYFFLGLIFSGTGTGTFFRDQFFPVPGPVLFSGTKFFRYRYRYFFPGPNFSGTGTGTFFRDQFFPVPVPVPSKKEQNSRDREFPGPGCHTLIAGQKCCSFNFGP